MQNGWAATNNMKFFLGAVFLIPAYNHRIQIIVLKVSWCIILNTDSQLKHFRGWSISRSIIFQIVYIHNALLLFTRLSFENDGGGATWISMFWLLSYL
jgi:dolichol kinase